jgi:hypothetical protein
MRAASLQGKQIRYLPAFFGTSTYACELRRTGRQGRQIYEYEIL